MDYEEWLATVPEEIKADSLWRVTAYRLALFLRDLGWHDTARLVKDRRMVSLADQLYRALGSISANLAEGYGRMTYGNYLRGDGLGPHPSPYPLPSPARRERGGGARRHAVSHSRRGRRRAGVR